MIIYAIMFLLTFLHINIIDKKLEIYLNVMSIFTAPFSVDKHQQNNVVFEKLVFFAISYGILVKA